MKISKIKIIVILFLTSVSASQEIDVESLFDEQDEQQDQSALVEYLESLLLQPIDVNVASVEQLSSIPWISTTVAVRIVEHRLKEGAFTDLDQLLKIKGMADDFDKSRVFLMVAARRSATKTLQGRHRIVRKIQNSRAYIEQHYSGSKDKVLNRIQGSYSSILQFGLLWEKDPGEQKLNDLSLGHLRWRLPLLDATIIMGHFCAKFGQGLVLWGPYRMGKGSDPLAPARQRSRYLNPYMSSAENDALYGVGVTANIGKLDIFAFTSRTTRDARIEDDIVLSMPISGLHRTDSERAAQDQLHENVHGGALIFHAGKNTNIGAAFHRSIWDFQFPKEEGVQQFEFSGMSNEVMGLSFDVARGNYNLFGEAARSTSGGIAANAGMLVELSPVQLLSVWRRYENNFHNRHAFAFGERTGSCNELGLYLGVRWRMHRQTTMSFYSDHYRFPWPDARLSMPGAGHDVMALFEHQLQQSFKIQIRLRSEIKTAEDAVADAMGNIANKISNPRKTYTRLQIDFDASRTLHLRSRIEFSFYERQNSTATNQRPGMLIYQDVAWRLSKSFRLQSRWSLFDAPTFDLRLYQFENDLPGTMRIKMFSGRGSRWYGILSYQWRKQLHCTFKFEHTFYDDRDSIGSSYDVISSAHENMASLQLDWRF